MTRCRFRHAVLLAASWVATPLVALGQTPALPLSPQAAPITLAALEQRALQNNPTLTQARAAVDAARGRAKQAGLLPNPTIGYSGDEVSRGPVIRGGEHGFFAEQTIPLGGKLGLSRAVFEREATEAEQIAESQRLRVINTVRTVFYETLAAQYRVDVRDRLARLAAEAVGISQQLFNTGAADRPDVLESEMEAQRERAALNAARNNLFRASRRLAAVVGDPELQPGALDGTIEAQAPELDRDGVLTSVLEQSPELKTARAAVERTQAALTRARREPVPDLVIRGGPRYNRERLEANGRPVGWESAFDVGLTIPLFNRNQGAIAASTADLSRSQREVGRLELSLRSRVADVFDTYLTALRTSEIYRDEIVPRAAQAYQLYLDRYRAMAVAYPQVLVAQRILFEANERFVDAAEQAWRAAVQLQGFMLVGGLDAPGIPGGAPGNETAPLMESTGTSSSRRIRP